MTLWHVNQIDWLHVLPPTAAKRLRQASQTLHFRDGQTIFSPEPRPGFVFILEAGLVRIYRLSGRGDEFTLGYIRPGEVFGELAVFGDAARESFAQSIDDCTVLMVPKALFSDLVKTVPDLGFSVTKQIEKRFKRIEARAEALVFRSVASRLAGVLLMLAEDFGKPRAEGCLIGLRVTQSEFATLVGAARATVNLTFQQFRAQGTIRQVRGHVLILNADALRLLAQDEETSPVGSV